MANEEQSRAWNEVNAPRWLLLREEMIRPLVPFGEAALRALAPTRGEAALDIGCGMGETTRELGLRTGSALGVDICQPFIETARAEASAEEGVRYLLADAQTHRFEERFALLFSRFGLMFFEDPAAAFANLRRALLPGGRLAAVVWGAWQENEWVTEPLRIVRRHLTAPDPPPGPGPFALADPAALAALLSGAGFSQVSIARLELPFQADARQLTSTGPAAAVLRENDAGDELRARIAAEISEALGERWPRAVALLATAIG